MVEINQITNVLLENGIYLETLLVIYSLPVLITIINFFKYIIGTKTIGTYVPIIIVYIFWAFTGLNAGFREIDILSILVDEVLITFILLFSIFGAIALFYSLFYKVKLHYLPKISTVLIFSIISLILLFWATVKLEFNFLERITPLAIVLIFIASEQFLSVYIKNDLAKAIYLFIETFIVSTLTYLIIIQPTLIDLIITNPWILLITLPLNILIGKFTGLRLTEYFRFYELLAENSNGDTSNTEE